MRTVLVFAVLLLFAAPVAAQQTATPVPLPTQEMYEAVATANSSLEQLPEDISNPGGNSMLPTDNSTVIIGYAKWLLSPAAADEWAGPFAPIFYHIGVGLYILFFLMGIYQGIYVIATVGRWIVWLWTEAHRLLDLTLQTLQAAPMLLVLVVVIAIAFFVFGQESVQDWIAENVESALTWADNILGDAMRNRP